MRTKRLDERTLFGLIDLVYDAAADASRWEPFLLSLAESVNGTAAHFLYHDLATSGLAMASARHHPDALRLYNEHFHQVDALAFSARARLATAGDILTDEMFVPRAELKRMEYFNDFAAKIDETRSVTLFLHKSATSNVITILRRERDAPFDHHEVRVLDALAPHLQRALQIHQRVHHVQHQGSAASQALDALPVALFVVDAEARILLANHRGRAMLAARDGVSTDRGRLTAASAADSKRLRDTCTAVAAARTAFPRHPGSAMRLGRPSGRPPLEALVTPTPSAPSLTLNGGRGTAFVFVSDPTDQPLPDTAWLQRCYGLSPAESDVARGLAAGKNLEQIAADRGRAIETVRRQNKQILAKTGARDRSEVLRRLSTVWRVDAAHDTPDS